TPLGQTLTRTQPGSMRDLAIMWMETHYAPFGELVHTIRTGQPAAEHLYGQPFFGWLAGQPGQAARFTGAMANLTDGIKAAAIPSLPLDGARTVVDVGGADGAMLAAILPGRPGLARHGGPGQVRGRRLLRVGAGRRRQLPRLLRAPRLARRPGPAHPGEH